MCNVSRQIEISFYAKQEIWEKILPKFMIITIVFANIKGEDLAKKALQQILVWAQLFSAMVRNSNQIEMK
jgi:hypothetical protein